MNNACKVSEECLAHSERSMEVVHAGVIINVPTLKGDFRKSPPVLQPAGRKGGTPSLPNHPPQWKEGPRELPLGSG